MELPSVSIVPEEAEIGRFIKEWLPVQNDGAEAFLNEYHEALRDDPADLFTAMTVVLHGALAGRRDAALGLAIGDIERYGQELAVSDEYMTLLDLALLTSPTEEKP